MRTEEQKREYRKQYYELNKERLKKLATTWRANNLERSNEIRANYRKANKLWDRVCAMKRRASSRGVGFDLTIEYVIDLKERTINCPILNLILDYEGSPHSDNAAEMDRIDSSLGYVKGNVHFISRRANRIKSDATLSELESIADYVRKITANG